MNIFTKIPPTTFLLILSMLFISLVVSGHRYLETKENAGRDNPVLVTDHQISWAAYARLEEGKEADYYQFTAKKGEEIYASLIIPKLDRLKGFAPDMALIGPGLEGLNLQEDVDDYLVVKEGEGLVVKKYSSKENEVFFEPFTQTSYWRRQKIRINAAESGIYHLVVFHHGGEKGKYVLAIGRKEVFGPGDILSLPATWWKVRMFAEQELSTYVITGLVLGGAGVGIFFLFNALF